MMIRMRPWATLRVGSVGGGSLIPGLSRCAAPVKVCPPAAMDEKKEEKRMKKK
jgi:hypothetical protein